LSEPLSIAQAAAHFAVSGGYLNTASSGVPPQSSVEAIQSAVARWGRGELSAADYEPLVASARQSFARLLGVAASDVAIGSAVSALVGIVASSLPVGSEVLCAEEEFTSVLFPFLLRQQAGELAVRLVPLQRLTESVRPGTALVALSAVQSADGRVFRRTELLAACKQHGAATLIDATQALGWLPLAGAEFDYVAVAAYKWLLAPRGAAFLYVNPARLAALRPHSAGWYAGEPVWDSIYGPPLRLASSARRLDVGPAWPSWVGCAAALAFLERVDMQLIHDHDVHLASLFSERVLGHPSDSAIVTVPGEAAYERLRAGNVAVSRRAGASRLSFHLYNTEEDALRAARLVTG
jgi:selenocysteine lyase/cysteine desulfurase